MVNKVTAKQAEKVLGFFAEEIAKMLGKDSVPTGREAMYHGAGPMLTMDWKGGSGPNPRIAIIFEGVISLDDDYDMVARIQKRIDEAKLPVYIEPYFSCVVCLYPN